MGGSPAERHAPSDLPGSHRGTAARTATPAPARSPVPAPDRSPVPAPARSPVPAPDRSPVPAPDRSPGTNRPRRHGGAAREDAGPAREVYWDEGEQRLFPGRGGAGGGAADAAAAGLVARAAAADA